MVFKAKRGGLVPECDFVTERKKIMNCENKVGEDGPPAIADDSKWVKMDHQLLLMTQSG